MADIVKRNGGSTLARGRGGFLAGVQNAMAATPQGPSDPILRLSKSGKWIYGQGSEEVQRGSRWVVRTWEVQHGFSSWTDEGGDAKNVLKGEVLVPVNAPLPDQMALPDTGWPWKPLIVWPMTCLNGTDEGTEVIYKAGSYGGKKASHGLFETIMERMSMVGEDYDFNCPVVQLDVNFYPHKKWGETAEPIITVVGWADDQGNPDPETTDANGMKVVEGEVLGPNDDEPPFETAKGKKAAKPPLDEPAPVEPAPASAARAGAPRRRPTGRASA